MDNPILMLSPSNILSLSTPDISHSWPGPSHAAQSGTSRSGRDQPRGGISVDDIVPDSEEDNPAPNGHTRQELAKSPQVPDDFNTHHLYSSSPTKGSASSDFDLPSWTALPVSAEPSEADTDNNDELALVEPLPSRPVSEKERLGTLEIPQGHVKRPTLGLVKTGPPSRNGSLKTGPPTRKPATSSTDSSSRGRKRPRSWIGGSNVVGSGDAASTSTQNQAYPPSTSQRLQHIPSGASSSTNASDFGFESATAHKKHSTAPTSRSTTTAGIQDDFSTRPSPSSSTSKARSNLPAEKAPSGISSSKQTNSKLGPLRSQSFAGVFITKPPPRAASKQLQIKPTQSELLPPDPVPRAWNETAQSHSGTSTPKTSNSGVNDSNGEEGLFTPAPTPPNDSLFTPAPTPPSSGATLTDSSISLASSFIQLSTSLSGVAKDWLADAQSSSSRSPSETEVATAPWTNEGLVEGGETHINENALTSNTSSHSPPEVPILSIRPSTAPDTASQGRGGESGGDDANASIPDSTSSLVTSLPSSKLSTPPSLSPSRGLGNDIDDTHGKAPETTISSHETPILTDGFGTPLNPTPAASDPPPPPPQQHSGPTTKSKPKPKFLGVIITTPPPFKATRAQGQGGIDGREESAHIHPRADVPQAPGSERTLSLALALSTAFERNRYISPPALPRHRPHASVSSSSSPPPTSTSTSSTPIVPPSTSLLHKPRPTHARHAKKVVPQSPWTRLKTAQRILKQDDIDRCLEVEVGEVRFGSGVIPDVPGEDEAVRMILRFLNVAGNRGGGIDNGDAPDCDVQMEDIGGVGRNQNVDIDNEAKAYAVREKTRAEMYIETMEGAFGPGVYRGNGTKPRKGQQHRGDKKPGSHTPVNSEGEDGSRAGSTGVEVEVEVNNRRDSSVEGTHVLLGKRRRENPEVEGDRYEEEETDPQRRNTGSRSSTEETGTIRLMTQGSVDEDTACDWTAALQKLIKGKTKMDHQGLGELGKLMDKIEGTKGQVEFKVLEGSRLGQSISQLSELEEIPFGDEEGLRGRAKRVREFWAVKYKTQK